MIRCLWRGFTIGFLLLNGIVHGFCQEIHSMPPESQKFFKQLNKKERVNLPFGVSWNEYKKGNISSRMGSKDKPWSYVPPFQNHLSDYIFAHQNDVGLLYLYMQSVPSPVQTIPSPLPTPKPKLPSKYTIATRPPSIVLGNPASLVPVPTPIPFARAMNQAKQSFQSQQYTQAAKDFEAAAQSQPKNPVVYMGLMFSYLESGEYDPAAAMLHRALELHEEWYKTPVNFALFYDENAVFQSSVQSLEIYAGEGSTDFEAKWLLGYCYFILGNRQKGLEVLDEIIRAQPEYREARKLRQHQLE